MLIFIIKLHYKVMDLCFVNHTFQGFKSQKKISRKENLLHVLNTIILYPKISYYLNMFCILNYFKNKFNMNSLCTNPSDVPGF